MLAMTQRVFGGRFKLVHVLKEGQGMTTWEGVDLPDETRIIIKLIPVASLSPNLRHRLEHEADLMRDTSSPRANIFIDWGRDDEFFYQVRHYVPGMTLQERLQSGPLPVREALQV